MDYSDFIKSKQIKVQPSGFDPGKDLSPHLFDWQSAIVRWALRKGKAALFEDCGLGKTIQQLEWAKHVCVHTSGDVLILAPLAVAEQTRREGLKFGIPVNVCRSQSDVVPGINVTNYEILDKFETDSFSGIVLDESSILKSHDSKTRNAIISAFSDTPYRLACTATPAPNDYMELANHAEFLGAMTRSEMLSMFFVHDGGDTSKWRLKGHAEDDFWRWLCSYAVMLKKPSDIGFSDRGYDLPPLSRIPIEVASAPPSDRLFAIEAKTLLERRGARRDSLPERVSVTAALVNESREPWIVWCDLNDESRALTKSIPDAIEVTGSDSLQMKSSAMNDFTEGKVRVLVSKPSICGWGMNWQHCSNMAFVGLSDSFEQMYQAERRCWRFGQKNPVTVYVVTSDAEGSVVRNIARKQSEFETMTAKMVEHMRDEMQSEIGSSTRTETEYNPQVPASNHSGVVSFRHEVKTIDCAYGQNFAVFNADCVPVMKAIDDQSIGYSVFSPPFASLYTYSNSSRDMGNTRSDKDFADQFQFALHELHRIMQAGRLVSIHCMNLPNTKERDGFIGIRDFRGELIRAMQSEGFIYHSEVCIWKDPVTAMQRTKAIGLLYKQLRKDSAMSRQGIPDYLVTFRKAGANQEPVTKSESTFPVSLWQRYASPVWMDIDPSDTLQRESAREDNDERHICPLQLQVIDRAIKLWTNPGDVVLSPFAGIGSEGHVAIQNDRKFVGIELKGSYFKQASLNLKAAERTAKSQAHLFGNEDDQSEHNSVDVAIGSRDKGIANKCDSSRGSKFYCEAEMDCGR